MNTFIEARIVDVKTTTDLLTLMFEDGRILSVPLVWSPRLFHATPKQRTNWELIGRGIGVHWPDVDEDLSAEGLLRGLPSIEYVRGKRLSRKTCQPANLAS